MELAMSKTRLEEKKKPKQGPQSLGNSLDKKDSNGAKGAKDQRYILFWCHH
jgi:hypothetical protein